MISKHLQVYLVLRRHCTYNHTELCRNTRWESAASLTLQLTTYTFTPLIAGWCFLWNHLRHLAYLPRSLFWYNQCLPVRNQPQVPATTTDDVFWVTTADETRWLYGDVCNGCFVVCGITRERLGYLNVVVTYVITRLIVRLAVSLHTIIIVL